nr:hypothetical protein [uncultured Draconibacterium sp.]
MTFEIFRKDIEHKLNSIVKFEMLEYHYTPNDFGSGILAYRIKGQNHKFVFDGKENSLTWFVSKPHQKYLDQNLIAVIKKDKLELSLDELKNGIKNGAQQAWYKA